MSTPRFKCGDVVRLASGGPLMTVYQYRENSAVVECEWFAGETEKHSAYSEPQLVFVPKWRQFYGA